MHGVSKASHRTLETNVRISLQRTFHGLRNLVSWVFCFTYLLRFFITSLHDEWSMVIIHQHHHHHWGVDVGHGLMVYRAPPLYSYIGRIQLNDCNLYFIPGIGALYYTGGSTGADCTPFINRCLQNRKQEGKHRKPKFKNWKPKTWRNTDCNSLRVFCWFKIGFQACWMPNCTLHNASWS